MGPYHPGLEEPYKLDMICEGETVQDAELHIGFNFRGIEHLAETRNYFQVIALMERVCGICSFIHTLTLCQAMEQLAGLEAPPRAQYIRVVMAELERLHSHDLLCPAREGHGRTSGHQRQPGELLNELRGRSQSRC